MPSAKRESILSCIAFVLSTLAAHAQGMPNSVSDAGPQIVRAEYKNFSTPACARRDLLLVTQLEAHGEAQTVAGEQLAEAFFTMMQARVACSEGREPDALALYDSITFVPVRTQATR